MQKYIIYRPTLILLLVEHYKAERISSHFPIYGHSPVKILNNELLLQSSGNYDIVLKILGIESESLKYFEANEIFAEHILERDFENVNALVNAINIHFNWLEGNL
jgi:hypothetical protein